MKHCLLADHPSSPGAGASVTLMLLLVIPATLGRDPRASSR
jgi:hypothetical protein